MDSIMACQISSNRKHGVSIRLASSSIRSLVSRVLVVSAEDKKIMSISEDQLYEAHNPVTNRKTTKVCISTNKARDISTLQCRPPISFTLREKPKMLKLSISWSHGNVHTCLVFGRSLFYNQRGEVKQELLVVGTQVFKIHLYTIDKHG